MSADAFEFEAGGFHYRMIHGDALEVLDVCARLGNASAALFGGMAQGRGAGRLANAVMYLLSSPELGPTCRFVVATLAKYTTVTGPSGKAVLLSECVGEHFKGRVKDLALWIEHAVEFECGDFLGDMVARVGAALAEQIKASASTSQTDVSATG